MIDKHGIQQQKAKIENLSSGDASKCINNMFVNVCLLWLSLKLH